ncbi:MAG: hypothetical protein C0621_08355 [Desulfuromonas sp.]|nr:MAG: hypothetical protein C0621_08355 [Desulfuromonas sp.]
MIQDDFNKMTDAMIFKVLRSASLLFVLLALLTPLKEAQAFQFAPSAASPGLEQVSQEVGGGVRSFRLEPETGSGFDAAELTMQQVYLQAGYGFVDNGEFYLRAGAAVLSMDHAFSVEDASLEGEGTPFAGFGVRGLLYRSRWLDLGGFLQGHYYAESVDERDADLALSEGGSVTVHETVTLSALWEANAAMSAEIKLQDFRFYVGPVYHYLSGSLQTEAMALGVSDKNEAAYGAESSVGIFAGLSVTLVPGTVISAEMQSGAETSYSLAVTMQTFSF